MSPMLSRHWPIAVIIIVYGVVVSSIIPVAIDDIRMAVERAEARLKQLSQSHTDTNNSNNNVNN